MILDRCGSLRIWSCNRQQILRSTVLVCLRPIVTIVKTKMEFDERVDIKYQPWITDCEAREKQNA